MKLKETLLRYILLITLLIPGYVLKAAEKESEFIVVIDAGHGGHDTGAIDNGVKEKDINLAVAKRLQEDIQKRLKGVKVVMTRSNDSFVTLQGRAEIANRNRADLFISIHTNSVDAKNPNRKTVAGTS
ncbi:MAG: N-acetylmuramoyl-L-alanine amidase, partial [Muribaculaceae bacterium]|nr:N-acetylmuramoyl-L-alanine amidase [Muribaculaceae bacterium]